MARRGRLPLPLLSLLPWLWLWVIVPAADKLECFSTSFTAYSKVK